MLVCVGLVELRDECTGLYSPGNEIESPRYGITSRTSCVTLEEASPDAISEGVMIFVHTSRYAREWRGPCELLPPHSPDLDTIEQKHRLYPELPK